MVPASSPTRVSSVGREPSEGWPGRAHAREKLELVNEQEYRRGASGRMREEKMDDGPGLDARAVRQNNSLLAEYPILPISIIKYSINLESCK